MFYRFAEFVAVVIVWLFVVTQLLIPAILGKKSFPIFRRESALLSKLDDVSQKKVEKKLEEEVRHEVDSLKET